MAKIEFSPAFMSGLPQRILNKNGTTTGTAPSGVGLINSLNGDNIIRLSLFSGTKLTKTQLDNNRTTFNGSLYSNTRNSNLLLEFTNGNTTNSSGNFEPSIVGTVATISTVYNPAIKTGLASWFCLHLASSNTNSIHNYITGDVGVKGSGADLEIADNNLILGEMYRVTNFKIHFPSSWEY